MGRQEVDHCRAKTKARHINKKGNLDIYYLVRSN